MKKLALCAVLVLAAGFMAAQEEPDENAVLQTAREEYQASQTQNANTDTNVTVTVDVNNTTNTTAQEPEKFMPFAIGFVPGLQFPFGYYSVSFGAFAIGGVVNNVYGFMGSGIFGIANDVYGFQSAGIFNIASSVYGFQGAGIFNMADGLTGSQFAGIFNMADHTEKAFQLAGIFNIAGGTAGVQAAGIFNIANNVQGIQAASIFNVANKVSGVQLGLVNVAESVQGIQIGLVNISHDGVNSIGTSYEPESHYLHLFWRNGSPALFALVQVGAPYTELFRESNDPLFSAGLGTRIGNKNIHLDADISSVVTTSQAELFAISLFNGTLNSSVLSSSFTSARLSLGLRLLGMNVFIGYCYDIQALDAGIIPESLKTGTRSGMSLFGTEYEVYRKWFFGISL
jgi:hypothetical protein